MSTLETDRNEGLVVDADGQIGEDVFCGQCRYNWRGLRAGAPCPECGTLMARANAWQRHSAVSTAAWLAANVILLLGSVGMFLVVRGGLAAILESFDTDPPALTKLLITTHPGGVIAAAAALAAVLAGAHFSLRSETGRRLHRLFLLGLLVGGFIAAVALVLPFLDLLSPVTG